MKKKLSILSILLILILSLTGCQAAPAEDNSEYKNSMENFFQGVSTLNDQMNALNPDDPDSVSDLFMYLSELEEQFKYFSEIEVPAEYQVTESLADEAYDYMKEANNYFSQSFSDNSFNEYTLEAAMECYSRANKRMQYVIDIIHGEMPEDENVTFE
ncbi:MAG: hypothetical protein MJ107_09040 [Lachnospiraceae bacterium]|nr:hypothetical protein [Lachnospiraceae bacterium]